VVVVGGGPAGSATALQLARAGIGVTLVERVDGAEGRRRKVCGEYQNSGAVAALDRLGALDTVRGAARPLQGIRLMTPGAPGVELRFERPALACDRGKLDSLLLAAAVDAGVRLVRGRVEGVLFAGQRAAGVIYRDASGEQVRLGARYVAGADGTGSLVARKLGLTRRLGARRRFAIGGHYRGFGDLNGFVEMYVGGGAYFALNPLDASRANVMLVVPQTTLESWSDVDTGMRAKADLLGAGRRSFTAVERLGERLSVGPLAHRVRSPVAPGAILVGVFLALTGAEAAAAAILRALHDRATEASAFAAYAAARARDFRARSALCSLVTLLMDVSPLARRAAVRLGRYPESRAALLDALGGIGAPQRGLAPGVLARLLV
jgi:2-polyprenyl-6-methoxyphenol hydroxylase-like FAD-dependent oxidoreductase